MHYLGFLYCLYLLHAQSKYILYNNINIHIKSPISDPYHIHIILLQLPLGSIQEQSDQD